MRKAVLLVTFLALAAAPTAEPAEAGAGVRKVKGHVIRVERQVRTDNFGSCDHLTIRTRQGDEMRLQLGAATRCPDCYRIGDRIRARIHSQTGSGSEYRIQRMQLRREGRVYDFTFEGDRMVHHPERGHHGRHHGLGARSPRGGRAGG